MKQVFKALMRSRKALRASRRHLWVELQRGESVGPGAPWLQLRLIGVATVGGAAAALLSGVETLPPALHDYLMDGILLVTSGWVGLDAVRSCSRLGVVPRFGKKRPPKRPPYG